MHFRHLDGTQWRFGAIPAARWQRVEGDVGAHFVRKPAAIQPPAQVVAVQVEESR
jgi:hypothetical protein